MASLAWTIAPTLALGHVVLSSRLVQLRWGPERLEVARLVSDHGGGHVTRQRGQFDGDGSGTLDDSERDRMAAWLDAREGRAFRLSLDGRPIRFGASRRELRDDRPDGQQGGNDVDEGLGYAMRSQAEVELCPRPGVHRLVVADAATTPGRLVPLRLDLPPGWSLGRCRAGDGVAPLAPIGEHAWAGGFLGESGELDCEVRVPPRVRAVVAPR